MHHVKRDANSAAHVLVRETIKNVIGRIWVEEILTYIYGIVIREQVTLV